MRALGFLIALRALFPLLGLCVLAVAGATYLAGGQIEVAAAAGLVAGLTAGGLHTLLASPLIARAEALSAAARQVQRELLLKPEVHTDDPIRLTEGLHAAARELARQLSVLTAVVDGLAEGLWITDPAGTIVRHNDALKQMLFAGQALVGQHPIEVIRNPELQAAVTRACDQGEPSTLELSVEGLRPRTLAIRVSPLRTEVGGSAAVFHDVTELRRLEKIRTDFVANVSHELRTPITAILGYAETLTAGALADHQHAPRMVEIIHRQSERLSELVEDLLELSRLESKEIQLAERPVALPQAATRAAEAIRPKASSKAIRVEITIAEGLTAIGDERAIEQVLLNLLDNAVKYTPAGGLVEVRGRAEGASCRIEVRDSGLGIEARHLPRIFERFYRVDKGRSREMGGTGLGLSIVKHLVTALSGEVRVTSRPGEGSTFTVLLPSSRQQSSTPE